MRAAPNRVPEVQTPRFPERYVPVLRHPLVQGLGEEVHAALCRAALYRFLNFTHKLELLVVNTVTANIALGRYDLAFCDPIRLDAHRIYVDEAFHALFSFEMMRKVRAEEPLAGLMEETTPAFLRRSEAIVTRGDPAVRPLLELMTVIASEMLITGTLRETATSSGMDPGVAAMIEDHARDEVRHHGFYKHVLREVWVKLSDAHRDLVLDHAQPLLEAYTAPDTRAIAAELRAVGLSPEEARQVVAETYDKEMVAEYARACGQGVYAALEEIAGPKARERAAEAACLHTDLEEVG